MLKLFLFSAIIVEVVAFSLNTRTLPQHRNYNKSLSFGITDAQCITASRKVRVKLFYQNPNDINYWSGDIEIMEKTSRMRTSSKIQSLLATGHSIVIQLRNRAAKLENDTNDQMKKNIYAQKLKDALLHLRTALTIARDADLKLGLISSQESLGAWHDVNKVYMNIEIQSNEKRENSLNDIVEACNALEIAFYKLQ